MNERIKDFADKIWTEEYWNNPNTDKLLPAQLNRFAELIVGECLDIAYEYDAPKMSGPGMIIGNRIKQHFEFGMTTEDKKTLIKELLGVKNV